MKWYIVSLLTADIALRLEPVVRYLQRNHGADVSLLLLRPRGLKDFGPQTNFTNLDVESIEVGDYATLKDHLRTRDGQYIFLSKQPLFKKHNALLLLLYLRCKETKYLTRFNLLVLRRSLLERAFRIREAWVTFVQTARNSVIDVFIDIASIAMWGLLSPGLLACLLRRFKNRQLRATEPPRKILFIRMDHLGDVICTLPALAALRRRYPDAEITFLGAPWSLQPVRSNRHLIDSIWEWRAPWHDKGAKYLIGPRGLSAFFRIVRKIRRERFDLVIQPRGDSLDVSLAILSEGGEVVSGVDVQRPLARFLLPFVKSPVVHNPFRTYHIEEWSRLAVEKVGCKLEARDLRSAWRDREGSLPDELLLFLKRVRPGSKLVAIAIGAGGRPREWPERKYARLIKLLAQEHIATVLVGASSDVGRANRILQVSAVDCSNLVGKTDFAMLARVLCRVGLVISPDTSIMHLASLLNRPVVAMFSSGNLELAAPRYGDAAIVKRELGCSGCGDRCMFKERFPCLDLVRIPRVVAAARNSV